VKALEFEHSAVTFDCDVAHQHLVSFIAFEDLKFYVGCFVGVVLHGYPYCRCNRKISTGTVFKKYFWQSHL